MSRKRTTTVYITLALLIAAAGVLGGYLIAVWA